MKSPRPALAIIAMALAATLAHAQAPDFSKVEIKATKVTDKFYTLEGQGGTIGVLVGPDGVFMVDTQFAPLSDKIAAAIKQISPQLPAGAPQPADEWHAGRAHAGDGTSAADLSRS